MECNTFSPCTLHAVTAHCPNLMKEDEAVQKFHSLLVVHLETLGVKGEWQQGEEVQLNDEQ